MKDSKNNNPVQIIVAVIGIIGVLGGALLANWDKIFPKKAREINGETPRPAMPKVVLSKAEQSTQGPQSPIITGVGGNVTINMGVPRPADKAGENQPKAKVVHIAGKWRTTILTNPRIEDERITLLIEIE